MQKNGRWSFRNWNCCDDAFITYGRLLRYIPVENGFFVVFRFPNTGCKTAEQIHSHKINFEVTISSRQFRVGHYYVPFSYFDSEFSTFSWICLRLQSFTADIINENGMIWWKVHKLMFFFFLVISTVEIVELKRSKNYNEHNLN